MSMPNPPPECEDGDLCACSSHSHPYDSELKRLQHQVATKRFNDTNSDMDTNSAENENSESKSKNKNRIGSKRQSREKNGGRKQRNKSNFDISSTYSMEREITNAEKTNESKVLEKSEKQPIRHIRKRPRKQLDFKKEGKNKRDLSARRNKSETADGVSLQPVKKRRTKNTSNACIGNSSINSIGESNDSNVSMGDETDLKPVSRNPRKMTKKKSSRNVTRKTSTKKARLSPDSENFTLVKETEQTSKSDSDSLKHAKDVSATEPESKETDSGDVSDCEAESWLNMSLPTPTGGRSQTETYTSLSHSSSSNQDSDSDSDLPEGWTPVSCDAKTFAERDLVWVKFRTDYYLPAIIKHIYKKNNTKRYTVIYFGPQEEPQLTMAPNCLLPFQSSRKDQIMEEGERLEKTQRDYFFQCVDSMQEFLSKLASKQLNDDNLWSFFEPQSAEVGDLDTSEPSPKPNGADTDEVKDSPSSQLKTDELDVQETGYEPAKPRIELSKKGKERVERRNEKTKKLTEFLISDTTKEYLKKIFGEKIPSELHDKFKTGTVKEKMKMKHRGFGPIDDDSQIESILDTYFRWIQKWSKNYLYLNKVDYVFDVWIPEAVVYGLIKVKGYGRKKAWDMFDKGVRTTKEELKLIQMEFDSSVNKRDSKFTEEILRFKPKKLILA